MKRLLVGVMFICLYASPALFAQSESGSVTGQVKDPQGAAVVGADVTATNFETGVAAETRTSETGTFSFPSLHPSRYKIAVKAAGFKEATLDVEAELLEVSKALRMNDAGIAVGGKIKGLVFDEECFFQFRKHDNAAHRWLRGGHQQPVVAAGIQADNRRRSKAAESVCLKPLTAECGVQIATGFSCELNHDRSPS